MQNKLSVGFGAVSLAVAATAVAVPVSIAGSDASAQRSANQASARLATARFAAGALLAAQPQRFHLAAEDVVSEPSVVVQDDLQYAAYTRTHRGLPVVGGDFVVVTDRGGAVRGAEVAQSQPLTVAITPTVSAARAAKVAAARLTRVDQVDPATLTVVARGAGRLAYEVVVTGAVGAAPSRQHVFVDARTGDVLPELSYDDVREVTGKGFYYGDVELDVAETLVDRGRAGVQCGGQDGRPMRVAGPLGDGSGTDLATACVDAMHAVAKEWDMLREWLGRDGIDGKGRGFPIRVGLNQVNAFWNGQFTSYGHSADNRRQLTAMDIVGHEFGHAIFQNTPGGSGGGSEAGGLNESAGDIFGALTEAFADDPKDTPDYDVGELADLAGKGPIRVMSNPSKVGDPNCFSDKIPSTEVHAAAGPQNHWFYLLAEGSRPPDGHPASPTCDGSEVTGIGVRKAGKIFMGALNRKTSGWTHAKARAASVAAAAELFPGGVECAAVKKAWSAVSVAPAAGEPACGASPAPEPSSTPTPGPSDGTATPGPSDYPPPGPGGGPPGRP